MSNTEDEVHTLVQRDFDTNDFHILHKPAPPEEKKTDDEE
ncbi:Uncharacterised protein [Yersinia enterocolitica]|nr:Uncharacterised protein [Yersinia enterocolitica]CNC45444.1 Uncharacterised protein [Yersinia enterocolitica]CNC56746.1 Uncharacterised protein [Yersinia enterocolitica]CNC67659.1 Uncharacterised protein [Yersinia enterocolitica]CNC88170.1 Uncharacterised protein [Yersinia enterocolitica]